MSNGDKLGPNDAEPTMSEDQITDAVRGGFNREGRSHDNLNGEHFEEFGPEQMKTEIANRVANAVTELRAALKAQGTHTFKIEEIDPLI